MCLNFSLVAHRNKEFSKRRKLHPEKARVEEIKVDMIEQA